MSSISNAQAQLFEIGYRQSIWIGLWVPKHLNENRLRETVQLRQGFPALGSDCIGLVENGGDAALFGEGREWDANLLKICS